VIIAAKHWREVAKSRQTNVQAAIRAHHALIAAVAVLDYAEDQQRREGRQRHRSPNNGIRDPVYTRYEAR
jgi:hypothetical protein